MSASLYVFFQFRRFRQFVGSGLMMVSLTLASSAHDGAGISSPLSNTLNPAMSPRPIEGTLDDLAPGAWTAVWVTDTQYYTEDHKDIGIFLKMTDWVSRHAQERHIRAFWHTGDIVDNNTPGEWNRARACLAVLNGQVPYALSLGNHDMGDNGKAYHRDTHFNDYFRLADNPLSADHFGGRYEAGKLDNTYWFWDEGPWKLLVFSLEFGVRPEVAAWAGGIAQQHPDRRAVLLTHEFLDDLSRLTSGDGWARRTQPETRASPHQYGIGRDTPERVLAGQGIWEHLVSRHPNFALTLNGHHRSWDLDASGEPATVQQLAASYRLDPGVSGQPVHQLFFNPQFIPDGGAGWLRLLEFQSDGVTLLVKTYSPLYAMDNDPSTPAWHPDARMHFQVRLR